MKIEIPKDLEQIAERAAKQKYVVNSYALHMDGFKDGVKWFAKHLNEIAVKLCKKCGDIQCKGCDK